MESARKRERLREKFLQMAKEKAAAFKQRDDLYLIQLSRTLEDLTESSNRFYEELETWYGLYIPELKTSERRRYIEAVLEINDRTDEVELEAVLKHLGVNEKITEAIKQSRGAKLSKEQLKRIKALAKILMAIHKTIDDYEAYIEEMAKKVAPNATELIGGKLVALFLSHAGSLEKLADMPASTIQVLGAEKALFKHLRSKGRIKPPKHGIILLSPYVSKLPKVLRGKMARTLAAKLAIAFKTDAVDKAKVWPQLKKAIERRYEALKEEAKHLPKKARRDVRETREAQEMGRRGYGRKKWRKEVKKPFRKGPRRK